MPCRRSMGAVWNSRLHVVAPTFDCALYTVISCRCGGMMQHLLSRWISPASLRDALVPTCTNDPLITGNSSVCTSAPETAHWFTSCMRQRTACCQPWMKCQHLGLRFNNQFLRIMMLHVKRALNVPGNGVCELWAVLQGSLHLPRSEQLECTCH